MNSKDKRERRERAAAATMRVLVYAAGVVALGAGIAESFAPPTQTAGAEAGYGRGLSTKRLRKNALDSRTATRMAGVGSAHEDAADVLSRTAAMMQDSSAKSTTASLEVAYAAPASPWSNAGVPPANQSSQTARWQPPVGYEPASRRHRAPTQSDPVMARVSELMAAAKADAAAPVVRNGDSGGRGFSPANHAAAAPPVRSIDYGAGGFQPESRTASQGPTTASTYDNKWRQDLDSERAPPSLRPAADVAPVSATYDSTHTFTQWCWSSCVHTTMPLQGCRGVRSLGSAFPWPGGRMPPPGTCAISISDACARAPPPAPSKESQQQAGSHTSSITPSDALTHARYRRHEGSDVKKEKARRWRAPDGYIPARLKLGDQNAG